jgi:hypothetical protein
MRLKRQSTKRKEMPVRSDVTTEDEDSPIYQESNDRSSRTPTDDGNDGDDTGGGTASLVTQGGGCRSGFATLSLELLQEQTRYGSFVGGSFGLVAANYG